MTHNEEQKIRHLAEEITDLSPEARDFLLHLFGIITPYDLRGWKVAIDDDPIGGRPCAVIKNRDGQEIERIDILGSIEDDLLSIGHPSILRAIHHWSQVVKFNHALSSTDFFLGNAYSEMAGKYLKKIVEVLKAHADGKHALPKHESLVGHIKYFSYDEESTNLHKAWELLGDETVKSVKDADRKIDTIEKRLSEFSYQDIKNGIITKSQVIEFLKTERGRRYVNMKRRPAWKTVRNAFLTWRFGLGVITDKESSATIVSYFSKSRKKVEDGSLNNPAQGVIGYKVFDLLELCEGLRLPHRIIR